MNQGPLLVFLRNDDGPYFRRCDHRHDKLTDRGETSNLIRKLGYLLSHRPDPGLVFARWNSRSRAAIPELLATTFPDQNFRAALHRIEHHLAHLSSAFHVCPFEDAVVVSVDGFGDFSSAVWGAARL